MSAPVPTTVRLAVSDNTDVEVDGYEVPDVPGLVVHRAHSFVSGEQSPGWVITHARSGRAISGLTRMESREAAISKAQRLAPLADWTHSQQNLREKRWTLSERVAEVFNGGTTSMMSARPPRLDTMQTCARCGDLLDGYASITTIEDGAETTRWYCHDSTRPSCYELEQQEALADSGCRPVLHLTIDTEHTR